MDSKSHLSVLQHFIFLSATGCFSFTVIIYCELFLLFQTFTGPSTWSYRPCSCLHRPLKTYWCATDTCNSESQDLLCFFFLFYCRFHLLTWIQRFQRVLHDSKSHTCCCQICNHLLNFKDVHQRATVRHGLVASAGRRYSMPIPICMGFHGLFVLFQKQADKQPRNPASPALTKNKKQKKCTSAQVHFFCFGLVWSYTYLPFHQFALWWLQPQFAHKAHSKKTSTKSYAAKNHNTKNALVAVNVLLCLEFEKCENY